MNEQAAAYLGTYRVGEGGHVLQAVARGPEPHLLVTWSGDLASAAWWSRGALFLDPVTARAFAAALPEGAYPDGANADGHLVYCTDLGAAVDMAGALRPAGFYVALVRGGLAYRHPHAL